VAGAEVRIEQRSPCSVALYRRLYRDVGETWFWHSRLEWSDERLAEHLASPDVGVWELMVDGESAGYFELVRHEGGAVEIEYFGLVPKFIGRGLGGMMLTRAVREAWAMGDGSNRVWLHTCTLDSENALPAYQARGFRPFWTEGLEVEFEGRVVVWDRLLPG
jgi:GNAT superfamily N-acetyltransferase